MMNYNNGGGSAPSLPPGLRIDNDEEFSGYNQSSSQPQAQSQNYNLPPGLKVDDDQSFLPAHQQQANQQPEMGVMGSAWEGLKSSGNKALGEIQALDTRLTEGFNEMLPEWAQPHTPYEISKMKANAKRNLLKAKKQREQAGAVGQAVATAGDIALDVAPYLVPVAGPFIGAATAGAEGYGNALTAGTPMEDADTAAGMRAFGSLLGGKGFRGAAKASAISDVIDQGAESYEQNKDFEWNPLRTGGAALLGGGLGKVVDKITTKDTDLSKVGTDYLDRGQIQEGVNKAKKIRDDVRDIYGEEQILTPESAPMAATNSSNKIIQSVGKRAFEKEHGYDAEVAQGQVTDNIITKMGNEKIREDGTQSFGNETLSDLDSQILNQSKALKEEMSKIKGEHYDLASMKKGDPSTYAAYTQSNLGMKARQKIRKDFNTMLMKNPHLDNKRIRDALDTMFVKVRKGKKMVPRSFSVEDMDGLFKSLNKIWKDEGSTDNVSINKLRDIFDNNIKDSKKWTLTGSDEVSLQDALAYRKATADVYKADLVKANQFIKDLNNASSVSDRDKILDAALRSDDYAEIVKITGSDLFDNYLRKIVKSVEQNADIRSKGNRAAMTDIRSKLQGIQDNLRRLETPSHQKYGDRGERALEATRRAVANKLKGSKITDVTLEGISESSRPGREVNRLKAAASALVKGGATMAIDPTAVVFTGKSILRDLRSIVAKGAAEGAFSKKTVDKLQKEFKELDASLSTDPKRLSDAKLEMIKRDLNLLVRDVMESEPEYVEEQESPEEQIQRLAETKVSRPTSEIAPVVEEESGTVVEEESSVPSTGTSKEFDLGGKSLNTLNKARLIRQMEKEGVSQVSVKNLDVGGLTVDAVINLDQLKAMKNESGKVGKEKMKPLSKIPSISMESETITEPEPTEPSAPIGLTSVKLSSRLEKINNVMADETSDFARVEIKPLLAEAKHFEKVMEKYNKPETMNTYGFMVDEFEELVKTIESKVYDRAQEKIDELKTRPLSSIEKEDELPELLRPKSSMTPEPTTMFTRKEFNKLHPMLT